MSPGTVPNFKPKSKLKLSRIIGCPNLTPIAGSLSILSHPHKMKEISWHLLEDRKHRENMLIII